MHVQISNGQVDPVRPGALRRYMTKEEWQELCHAVEDAFYPAVWHNECMATLHGIFLAMALVGMFTILVGPVGIFIVFGAAFVMAMIVMNCSLYRHCCLEASVEARVDQVLRDFSESSKAGLTFHLLL